MAKQVLKVGQIVRPARTPDSGIKFGALVRIESIKTDGLWVVALRHGDMLPVCPAEGWLSYYHWLRFENVKLAKQANKREGR